MAILSSQLMITYNCSKHASMWYLFDSNAIRFTREGKVGINLYVIHDPCACKQGDFPRITYTDEQTGPLNESKDRKFLLTSQSRSDQKDFDGKKHEESPYRIHVHNDETRIPLQDGASENAERGEYPPKETTLWIQCDVYDTGIGIPGTIYWFIYLYSKGS